MRFFKIFFVVFILSIIALKSHAKVLDLEFRDIPLSQFIKIASKHTDKPFVADTTKTKDIIVSFSAKIQKTSFIDFLKTYLQSLNLYLYEKPDFYYISDGEYSDIANANKQVLVRAVIVESAVEDAERLGLELSKGDSVTLKADIAPSPNGLIYSLLPHSNLSAVLQAIKKNSSSKILSSPTLLTRHNKEGHIIVGQNVPTVGERKESDDGDKETQSVDRQDVGVSLDIKPFLLSTGEIALTVKTTASTISNSAAATDIIFDTRSIDTELVVKSDSLIYLGGLINSETIEVKSGVPFLSDIPFLGRIFTSTKKEIKKKQMDIFISVNLQE